MTDSIGMIRSGRWCRNTTRSNEGAHCALGLISASCQGDWVVSDAMKELLDAAIPQEEFHALEARVSAARGRRDSYMEHSGYWRGGDSKTGRIASFNNTRPTEREVAAWFEDARELLEQTPTA